MFATGQERCCLLVGVQSAEEVWNANFTRIKRMRGRSSWGVGGLEEEEKKTNNERLLGVRMQFLKKQELDLDKKSNESEETAQ